MSAEQGWQELGRLTRARVTLFPSEGIETIETPVVGIWAVQMGCSALGRERYFTLEASDATPFAASVGFKVGASVLSASRRLSSGRNDLMCRSGTCFANVESAPDSEQTLKEEKAWECFAQQTS